MQIKDKADYLALYGRCVAVILGNVEGRDFELVDVDAVPLDTKTAADFTARGLGYCGTYALMDGQFCQAYALPLDAALKVALASQYARFVVEKSSRPDGPGVDWLKKLFSLPDPREAN